MNSNCQNTNLSLSSDRLHQTTENELNLADCIAEACQETQLSSTFERTIKIQQNEIDSKNITFVVVLFLLSIAVGLMTKTYFLKAEKKRLNSIKRGHKISCRQCYYYNNNHYLKCALHPDLVLTKEAKSCRDYQSN